jgi:hypothetical protein
MAKKKIPFYLTVVKTEDDTLYCPIGETPSMEEAGYFVRSEMDSIRKAGLPIRKIDAVEIHIVVEQWESEEDYDNGSGSVDTISDIALKVKKSFAKRYDL